MLQTVTQNAKFREQYRLHEELLRVQKGEESRRQQLQKALTQEMAAKEAALQKVEEVEKRSILLISTVLSFRNSLKSSRQSKVFIFKFKN